LSEAGHGLSSLIQRCNRGDRQAWEEFYATYFGLVSSVAKRYSSSHSNDLEDVIQEVFISLFAALKHYDPARSIEAYILEIARRVRIGQHRKATAAKRVGNPVPLEGHEKNSERESVEIASANEDQEHSLIKAQEKSLLRKALDRISESCQDLLQLRYDRALSYKEIADILNIKEATLRSQVQRCLSALSASYLSLTALRGE